MKTQKLLLLFAICLAVSSCQKKPYASFQSNLTENYSSAKSTGSRQIIPLEAITQAKPINVTTSFLSSPKNTQELHAEIRNENLERLNSRKKDLKSQLSVLKANYRQIKTDTLVKDKSLSLDKVSGKRAKLARNLSLIGVGLAAAAILMAFTPAIIFSGFLAFLSLLLSFIGAIVGFSIPKGTNGKRPKMAQTAIGVGLGFILLLLASFLFLAANVGFS